MHQLTCFLMQFFSKRCLQIIFMNQFINEDCRCVNGCKQRARTDVAVNDVIFLHLF